MECPKKKPMSLEEIKQTYMVHQLAPNLPQYFHVNVDDFRWMFEEITALMDRVKELEGALKTLGVKNGD